ncbi:NAD(P)H-dependent oxidoreductase [Rhizobium metallidurans]|uniref:Putative NADPH-quinone reductase n=1 Tax=Rhizobium metallidurans TaxID=1265931 RepID=A0A7W6CY79_9HYPH|nr:NAD(P)H-dependent oxidoreductase [Rhizobium metallidurans]MBB3965885.1 putative NADPH-quinone reductase [Rhizobium metallidurans]
MPLKKIMIIDGHPDPHEERFCHALVNSYALAAAGAGHTVRRVSLAGVDIPFLRSEVDWDQKPVPADLTEAQEGIGWADHLVLVYPLWLGSMPALLQAFLEQVLRPGFAIAPDDRNFEKGMLRSKSARIVVTMAMPAMLFRIFMLARNLTMPRQNVMYVAGIDPIFATLIGDIGGIDDARRRQWLARIERLGRRGA